MSKGELSKKENKAIKHIEGVLTEEFNIPAADVSIEMLHDVKVHEGGNEITVNKIKVSIAKPVYDDKQEPVMTAILQGKLADEISGIWKRKAPPMIHVDVPSHNIPAEGIIKTSDNKHSPVMPQ